MQQCHAPSLLPSIRSFRESFVQRCAELCATLQRPCLIALPEGVDRVKQVIKSEEEMVAEALAERQKLMFAPVEVLRHDQPDTMVARILKSPDSEEGIQELEELSKQLDHCKFVGQEAYEESCMSVCNQDMIDSVVEVLHRPREDRSFSDLMRIQRVLLEADEHLLQHINPADLRGLCADATLAHFKPGSMLHRQSEHSHSFYVVLGGRVLVYDAARVHSSKYGEPSTSFHCRLSLVRVGRSPMMSAHAHAPVSCRSLSTATTIAIPVDHRLHKHRAMFTLAPEALEKRMRRIQSHPQLSRLPKTVLHDLAFGTQERQCRQGEFLQKEGEHASRIILIERGNVLMKVGKRTVATFGEGEICGPSSLLTREGLQIQPALSSLVCGRSVAALIFPRAEIRKAIGANKRRFDDFEGSVCQRLFDELIQKERLLQRLRDAVEIVPDLPLQVVHLLQHESDIFAVQDEANVIRWVKARPEYRWTPLGSPAESKQLGQTPLLLPPCLPAGATTPRSWSLSGAHLDVQVCVEMSGDARKAMKTEMRREGERAASGTPMSTSSLGHHTRTHSRSRTASHSSSGSSRAGRSRVEVETDADADGFFNLRISTRPGTAVKSSSSSSSSLSGRAGRRWQRPATAAARLRGEPNYRQDLNSAHAECEPEADDMVVQMKPNQRRVSERVNDDIGDRLRLGPQTGGSGWWWNRRSTLDEPDIGETERNTCDKQLHHAERIVSVHRLKTIRYLRKFPRRGIAHSQAKKCIEGCSN